MTANPETLRALKRAGAHSSKWTARRDELIRQAVAEGGNLREVGAAAGMSHQAIKYIAHGRKPAGEAQSRAEGSRGDSGQSWPV